MGLDGSSDLGGGEGLTEGEDMAWHGSWPKNRNLPYCTVLYCMPVRQSASQCLGGGFGRCSVLERDGMGCDARTLIGADRLALALLGWASGAV